MLLPLYLAVSALAADPLWLRYGSVVPRPALYGQIGAVAVRVAAGDYSALCQDPAALPALRAAAAELSTALTGLLGRAVPSTCCGCAGDSGGSGGGGDDNASSPTSQTLLVTVGGAAHLGPEGFTVTPRTVTAHTPSGALYGAFRLLSLVQQHRPLPANLTARPAMRLRAWNMWDTLTGRVEQGAAGLSLLWPYALYEDGRPPPRDMLFVAAACNASDPHQQWEGGPWVVDGGDGAPTAPAAVIRNVATSTCLTSMSCDPILAGPCAGAAAARFVYNRTNQTLVLDGDGSTAPGRCGRGRGLCFDLNNGVGPDIDLWRCHGADNPDYAHQRFFYNAGTRAIQVVVGAGEPPRCLTLGRSAPLPDAARNDDDPWAGGAWKKRAVDLLRLLKSSGINTLVLNDVNACGAAGTPLLQPAQLANWTRNLGPLLEAWAIVPMISLCFAAPTELANVTADPLDPAAVAWWSGTLAAVYAALPSFGGVLVKADSEGNIGPMSFNRTEADGANMLARLLRPRGGVVLWRAFVYGNPRPTARVGQEDLARQSYDTFKPLDGAFDGNVVLQVKSGPYDFQVREPVHPLLGGMPQTNVMMEVSANQGYTGHQIHVCNLAQQWKSYLEWDTMAGPGGSSLTIAQLLTAEERGGASAWGGGMACVSNVGNRDNMTGHVLAAANTYACGRLAWDPTLDAGAVDREWAAMTFPAEGEGEGEGAGGGGATVDAVTDILGRSWLVYEGYTSPMGIGFMIGQNNPFGCAPKTNRSAGGGEGPGGAQCPPTPHPPFGASYYWMNPCDDYDFANYSRGGLGCDRTSAGAGSRMADTYSPGVRAVLDDPATIPPELTLFFHNKRWTDLVPPYGGGGRGGGGGGGGGGGATRAAAYRSSSA